MMQQPQQITSGVSETIEVDEAVGELIRSFGDVNPSAVMFFASSRYDIEKVGSTLSERYKEAQVIGCTTAGEINSLGCSYNSLCGFALPRESFSVSSTVLNKLSNFDMKSARSQVSELFSDLAVHGVAPVPGNTFGFLLVDGLSGEEETVLSAIHDVIGDVQLFGGSAGDDLHFQKTMIYQNGTAHNR